MVGARRGEEGDHLLPPLEAADGRGWVGGGEREGRRPPPPQKHLMVGPRGIGGRNEATPRQKMVGARQKGEGESLLPPPLFLVSPIAYPPVVLKVWVVGPSWDVPASSQGVAQSWACDLALPSRNAGAVAPILCSH